MCYDSPSKNPDCLKRSDAKTLSCRDLGNTACLKTGWRLDALYNGSTYSKTMHSSNAFGLSCYSNYYGVCKDETTCESGGSCNDWTYAQWWGDSNVEDKVTCRVPFTSFNDWGPDYSACFDLSNYAKNQYANFVPGDACIVSNMKESDCFAAGGTAVARAETELQCTRFKGCFKDGWTALITKVAEEQCKNQDICNPNQYKWKNVLEWTPGVWTPSQMTTAGIEWTERQLKGQNKWLKVLSYEQLSELVQNAGYAMAAEAYKAEFLCQMEPLYAILERISCACSSDRNKYSQECTEVFDKITSSTILSETLFADTEMQTLYKPGFGSVAISSQNIMGSISGESDNVEISLLTTNSMLLRQSDGRRAVTTAMTCAQFEIIKDSNGHVVGQLAGNGFAVQGLKSGTARVCLPTDEKIPKCLDKFKVQDFALGDEKGMPSVPLKLDVSIDKSNQFCGDVPLVSFVLPDLTILLSPLYLTINFLHAGGRRRDARIPCAAHG
jgi:hypothetical protein